MSSCNCTNAPKLASLVTLPLTRSPILYFLSIVFHGSSAELFNPEADALIGLVDFDHDSFHFIGLLKHSRKDD